MSEWIPLHHPFNGIPASQSSAPNHQNSLITNNTNKVHSTNIRINNSNHLQNTKKNLSSKSQQCPIWLCSFVPGLILGCLISGLALATILTLWLTSTTSTTTITSTKTTTITTKTTSTTTTAYYSCSNFTVKYKWNYPGNDINSATPMSFSLCCSWCQATSTCTTFVLTNTSSTCWIKTSPGAGGGSSSNDIGATR